MESTTSSLRRKLLALVHCATSMTRQPVMLCVMPGIDSRRAALVMSCSSKPWRHMLTDELCRR
eukprot:20008-Eustigmatos_ZCMA.PRE.1